MSLASSHYMSSQQLTHHRTIIPSYQQIQTSRYSILGGISRYLRHSANISDRPPPPQKTHTSFAMSEVYCFPFAALDQWYFDAEMIHYFRDAKVRWDSDMPNPLVPFPNQPTFVIQFQFWASCLQGHVKDPEPYLPGQVHGLHGPSFTDSDYVPRVENALFRAFKKNGITDCTVTRGVDETLAFKGHPPHVLCRGFPQIDDYGSEVQNPMRQGGGYNAKQEPWIPLWQIHSPEDSSWKPMNLQRYDIAFVEVISPVLPLTEESYIEVDRVAHTIIQTLRVQKKDGPGINVRCESRSNFCWPSTSHRLPANLKNTLEARFSRVPQVDEERRLAFAHEMFNEILTTGPQPARFLLERPSAGRFDDE